MKIRIAMTLSGATAYCHLVNQETGLIWNGAGTEEFTAANEANYAVTITDPSNRKVYEADVPDDLPAGRWDVFGYVQTGGSPNLDDDPLGGSGVLDYPGAGGTVIGSPLGSITGSAFYEYVVRSGLVRRDMEEEVYDELLNTILEIQQTPELDVAEFEVEESFTDTIASLGDYKLSPQSNTGKLRGVRLKDGTFSRPLEKISKAEYDRRYPDPSTDNFHGRPRDWCYHAGQILLGPCPDSLAYEYVQVYTSRLTTTIAASTTIPMSAEYREVLKDGVLWRIFENLKNYTEADRFARRYSAGVARMITHQRENQEPGGEQMDYHGV